MESIVAEWLVWMVPMTWQVALLTGVIWLVSLVSRKVSAEFLALIWLLVFVRLLLPPTISTPWSIADWTYGLFPNGISTAFLDSGVSQVTSLEIASTASTTPVTSESVTIDWSNIGTMAFAVWLAVAIGLALLVVAQHWRYWGRIRKNLSSPSTGLQNLFERQIRSMGMTNTIVLRLSGAVDSPGIFGVNVPIVLLPIDAEEKYDVDSLRDIFCHELAHIRRHDLLVGYGVSLLACAYWFHPAVWFSLIQYRRNRELACDEMALRISEGDGLGFAKTILLVAEKSRQPVPMSVGFLGILEQSDNLVRRVRAAQSDGPVRSMSNLGLVAILAMTALLLPMGQWNSQTSAQSTSDTAAPQVVSTIPAIGAMNVDPSRTEIKVTFDQDMEGGFSWTGGGDLFPKVSSKPEWLDKRTCVLPVELEQGSFYRLGINASSFGNFRGINTKSAQLNVIYFTTKDADEATLAKRTVPKIVSMTPTNAAADVDPTLSEITVTFDKPMGQGFSWVGSGESFPTTTKPASWSEDRLSSTIYVSLKPGATYSFGLNSAYHNNFQSEFGVPLSPVTWTFTTQTN